MLKVLRSFSLFIFGGVLIYYSGKFLFSKDTAAILLVPYVLSVLLFTLIRIALKVRKVGGSMMTVTTGALDQFYNKDQKRSFDTILEVKKHGKLEEQAAPDKDKKTAEQDSYS